MTLARKTAERLQEHYPDREGFGFRMLTRAWRSLGGDVDEDGCISEEAVEEIRAELHTVRVAEVIPGFERVQ